MEGLSAGIRLRPSLLGQIVLPFPGIPKPHAITERAFNQQPAPGPVGPPGAAAASELPVKGLSASLSSSTDHSRAMTTGGRRETRRVRTCWNRFEDLNSSCFFPPTLASASTAGTDLNDRPSRSSAKPVCPASTSAPSAPSATASCTVPKLRVTGGRTPTLRTRTSGSS